MLGTVALTGDLVGAGGGGREPERSQLLECLAPQVRLMVTGRLAPRPGQFDLVDEFTQQTLAALAISYSFSASSTRSHT